MLYELAKCHNQLFNNLRMRRSLVKIVRNVKNWDQNRDRVSHNDKSCHICSMKLKCISVKYEKYGTLSIYNHHLTSISVQSWNSQFCLLADFFIGQLPIEGKDIRVLLISTRIVTINNFDFSPDFWFAIWQQLTFSWASILDFWLLLMHQLLESFGVMQSIGNFRRDARCVKIAKAFYRRMLKAPHANPSKIRPREGCEYVLKYVQKSSKNWKKVDNGLFPIKKGGQKCFMSDKCHFFNLDPIKIWPTLSF